MTDIGLMTTLAATAVLAALLACVRSGSAIRRVRRLEDRDLRRMSRAAARRAADEHRLTTNGHPTGPRDAA